MNPITPLISEFYNIRAKFYAPLTEPCGYSQKSWFPMFFKSFCKKENYSRWAICVTIGLLFSVNTALAWDVDLSQEEYQWLQDHNTIRIAIDPGYAPYSFVDNNGELQGIVPELLAHMQNALGVTFQAVTHLTWAEIIESTKSGQIDVIATAVLTEERKQFLAFSDIYISTPLVIVTELSNDSIRSPKDLAGQKVALVDQYSSAERVKQEHPTIRDFYYPSPLASLQALAVGDVDAHIGVLGVLTYLARENGLNNLKIAGQYDLEQNGQRFAVRKDWSILATILDKSFKSMPLAEKEAIFQRWVGLSTNQQSTKPPSFNWYLSIAVLLSLVLMFALRKIYLLRNESLLDPLTQVYNRSFLNKQINREIANAKKTKRPLTLLMVDIDHFKSINDNYGHQVGDEVLKVFSATLKQSFRKSDYVCRYGGEEFTIILPASPTDDALASIQRLKDAWLAQTKKQKLLGGEAHVTFTIGLASFPLEADSAIELIKLADDRLYQGKNNGRNQTVYQA